MTKINLGWEYDGVDLSTYAYDIRALGAPEQVPGRRGDNVAVPGRTGRLYVPKLLDQRILPLAMFVDSKHPTSGSLTRSAAQLQSNLDALKAVLARDGQHQLVCTLPGSVTRYAMAEVANVVEFQPTGPWSYALLVEFTFADPFWYASTATTVGPTTIIQSPQSIAVNNAGTYKAEKALLTIEGPLTDPKLTIGSVWVQYTGSIGSGETLEFDCDTWTAELEGVDVTGNVSHDGALRWLEVPAGVSTLVVTSSGYGAGTTVTLAFTPTYI